MHPHLLCPAIGIQETALQRVAKARHNADTAGQQSVTQLDKMELAVRSTAGGRRSVHAFGTLHVVITMTGGPLLYTRWA